MGTDKNEKPAETGYSKLYRGLATGATNLWGVLGGKFADRLVRLSVRRRGAKDYMCSVAVISATDGKEYIAFGNGTDFVEALTAVSATIGKGRWVESRPYGDGGNAVKGVLTALAGTEAQEDTHPLF